MLNRPFAAAFAALAASATLLAIDALLAVTVAGRFATNLM